MQLWTNNCQSTLSVAVTTSSLSFYVQLNAGTLYPSPGAGDFFLLTLDDGNNVEIIKITSRSGDQLICGTLDNRHQESTSASAFAVGTRADLRITAGPLRVMSEFVQQGDNSISVNIPYLTIVGTPGGRSGSTQLRVTSSNVTGGISYGNIGIAHIDSIQSAPGDILGISIGGYYDGSYHADRANNTGSAIVMTNWNGSSTIGFQTTYINGVLPRQNVAITGDGNLIIGEGPTLGNNFGAHGILAFTDIGVGAFNGGFVPSPPTSPSTYGVGWLYVDHGALKYRAPGGRDTIIGPAT